MHSSHLFLVKAKCFECKCSDILGKWWLVLSEATFFFNFLNEIQRWWYKIKIYTNSSSSVECESFTNNLILRLLLAKERIEIYEIFGLAWKVWLIPSAERMRKCNTSRLRWSISRLAWTARVSTFLFNEYQECVFTLTTLSLNSIQFSGGF